jgi:uncharacterized protein YjeT (DUF2065 family)
MPDNWSFVAAAYGLTALVLGLYWRRLARKEKTLSELTKRVAGTASSVVGTASSVAERSQSPSGPAHPRREPDTTGSVQQ